MSGYYKRPPFRLQKVAFYMQKDGLLHLKGCLLENVRFSFLSAFLYFVLLLSDERHGKASAGSSCSLSTSPFLTILCVISYALGFFS